MVGHGGSSAGSYLADPTSPIPSHCASIVATSTVRVEAMLYCICTLNEHESYCIFSRVHDFKWHGSDPNSKGHMIAGLNTLQQLPCIADQFYYNVREVRTNDDTMLTVKLMIFYQLKDIITMVRDIFL